MYTNDLKSLIFIHTSTAVKLFNLQRVNSTFSSLPLFMSTSQQEPCGKVHSPRNRIWKGRVWTPGRKKQSSGFYWEFGGGPLPIITTLSSTESKSEQRGGVKVFISCVLCRWLCFQRCLTFGIETSEGLMCDHKGSLMTFCSVTCTHTHTRIVKQ